MGQVDISPLLRALVLATHATRVLEIGTATGHSSVSMGGALPKNGMLITMESDESLATEARASVQQAGLADRVNVIVSDAQRMLHKLAGPFDLIAQSGDSTQYAALLDTLVGLLRPGGVLVTHGVHTHPLLLTSIVPLGGGVAISVKRSSHE